MTGFVDDTGWKAIWIGQDLDKAVGKTMIGGRPSAWADLTCTPLYCSSVAHAVAPRDGYRPDIGCRI